MASKRTLTCIFFLAGTPYTKITFHWKTVSSNNYILFFFLVKSVVRALFPVL